MLPLSAGLPAPLRVCEQLKEQMDEFQTKLPLIAAEVEEEEEEQDPNLAAEAIERVMELLLSQERVISLLYSKTFLKVLKSRGLVSGAASSSK